mmetsp:Transcript_18541/g.54245  ORF Transcript_18541/g.54245 Transcript_18541/m.54245 type:complete len:163 (+) Transcript_18541:353-841(+)
MPACYECAADAERLMLKKYCTACYWRMKRAVERDCGLSECHGRDKARLCPVCASYRALSARYVDAPSKKAFCELYRRRPRCAISGHAFDPARDGEQLLPAPVCREQGAGHSADNLVFVCRLYANAMRNGHASLEDVAEAAGALSSDPSESAPSSRLTVCSAP